MTDGQHGVRQTPRMVAFDLDDTLAPSKQPIDSSIAHLLHLLLAVTSVCIISGGQFAQFERQVLARLGEVSEDYLARLHLMPTCGTRYERFIDSQWRTVYAHNLEADEKSTIVSVIQAATATLKLIEPETWGPTIEDRGSQITFSALGQSAPIAPKKEWDPSGWKKASLQRMVQDQLPQFEVRSGGSTSIDVTHQGIDKAYGIRALSQQTGIPLSDFLFVGDRLDVGGNDYPVYLLGVTCVAVDSWKSTARVISDLVENARTPSAD